MTTFMGIVGTIVVFFGAILFLISSILFFQQGLLEKGFAYLLTAIFLMASVVWLLQIAFDNGSDDGNWF